LGVIIIDITHVPDVVVLFYIKVIVLVWGLQAKAKMEWV